MSVSLREALTSGVLVEFYDPFGRTLGQSVFADWQGRPVPAVGDQVCCPAGYGSPRKLWGEVIARHFDVQRDEQGTTCVWARLSVRCGQPLPHANHRLLGV